MDIFKSLVKLAFWAGIGFLVGRGLKDVIESIGGMF